MLALIDGDIAAYRAASATQKSIDWGPEDAPSIYVRPEEAAVAAVETVRLWTLAAGATKALVCLTGRGNFRKDVYPLYKSNRSGKERPKALEAVREALRDEFKTAIVDGLEADDVMGLTLTAPSMVGKAVCVSIDKDLKTVPGLHFNPMKDALPAVVTEAQANGMWFTQALTGDPSDGYPGCRKVGPIKAARILSGWDGRDMEAGWALVLQAFWEAGGVNDEEDAALQMLRVSRILRHGDYDKTTKEVRLWHPTTPERLRLH